MYIFLYNILPSVNSSNILSAKTCLGFSVRYVGPNILGQPSIYQQFPGGSYLDQKLWLSYFIGITCFIPLCFIAFFTDTVLFTNWRFFEGPASSKPCWCHFPKSICLLCICMSHFGNYHSISSHPLTKRFMTCWRSLIVFFSNKVF